MTREESIEVGGQLTAANVQVALVDAIALAERDRAGLTLFGWTPARTAGLVAVQGELAAALRGYETRYGQHLARTKATANDIDTGKRWRLRVLALLQLGHAEAETEYRAYAWRSGRDPDKLGQQIAGLLGVARKYEAALRENCGADDAFFAEGERLVASLQAGAAARRQRPRDLPAERDRVDEVCGRAWEQLKALNVAGRSLHRANGDRALAAQYTLDVLYGRPLGRGRQPAAAATPPAPTP